MVNKNKALTLTELMVVVAILAIIMTFGCTRAFKSNKTISSTGELYAIRVIEGCEYIATRTYLGYETLCHKGNCTNSIHIYRVEATK